jgi:hypothetical protein
MARTFSREEFYDLVWSKPMTHLAKEFALSDVALHKVCKKHGIPNPPLGWWAKKAAGKAVKQTPLPPLKSGAGSRITIASGELRPEPELIATARENARVLASAIEEAGEPPANPTVERTVAKLRKAKPSAINGLASVNQPGLIKVEVATASADRLELALNRIAAAGATMGIKIVRTEKAAGFECGGEVIGFSVAETVKREKHVLTENEHAEEAAWRKKNEKRWSKSRNSWDDMDFSFTRPRFPEWDYHPTGLLSFELEHSYFVGCSPRRSYRDAKVQRLENMAVDIAVGIVVLVAARKEDRLRREEEARRREEERQRRELALREEHVEKRRSAALEELLDEVGALDRLRRLVTTLRNEQGTSAEGRVGDFLAFADARLAEREAALTAANLEKRLEKERLFGEDDDHNFRPQHSYY